MRSILLRPTFVLLLGCLWPGGPARADDPAAPAPSIRKVGAAPTEEECLELADEITEVVYSGDAPGFNRLIHWPSVVRRSTAGIDAPEPFRAGFALGVERAVASDKSLAAAIVKIVREGGTYTLLHNYTKEGQRRLLFRLIHPDSGANYHDLLVERLPDGKARIADIYVFLSGEWFSQTLRSGYLLGLAQEKAGLIERLTGADRKYAEYFEKLKEMNAFFHDGKHREALAVYKSFPPDLKDERNIMMIRMQAALGSGDDAAYAEAIEDYRKAHPKDACVDLISIDFHIIRKQYREALACIDNLDKAVLGDPYLDVTRANVRVEQGDLPGARAAARRALDAEPELYDAWWSLVGIALQEKDHAETLRLLRHVRDAFQPEFGDLTAVPEYKAFTESPQYREWLEENREAAKEAEKEQP